MPSTGSVGHFEPTDIPREAVLEYCDNWFVSATDVIELHNRPVYGFAQVDRILGLKPSTAQRWIDGYTRGGRRYPPVIRTERTGDETVTWGEFIEARLLSQYREEGALVARIRPAVERLREELNTPYPLASAKTWLGVAGRELVRKVQEDVGLDRRLLLVVVRTDQQVIEWSPQAQEFIDSLHWQEAGSGENTHQVIDRLNPDPAIRDVMVDPLRRFGEPSIHGVPTEVIRELYTAGDPVEMISELYRLPPYAVEAALRFELRAADGYAVRAS